MKLYRDESLRDDSINFRKLTISPNVQDHVFRPDVLRYRNSSTRRRNEAAYVQDVARQTEHIGIRTRKPVDFCRGRAINEDWERVHEILFDARAAVALHQFGQNGLENFAVALSPFGNDHFQFVAGHGREFITAKRSELITRFQAFLAAWLHRKAGGGEMLPNCYRRG